MKCELLSFDKETIQVEKEGKNVIREFALIKLRAEMPDNLPVGKLLELSVAKDEPNDNEEDDVPEPVTSG